jgi:hypothetical protein
MFAGGFFRPGHTRHNRSRLPWPHFVLVTGLVALGAVPFSHLGARLAIKTRAAKLERWYGLALTGLGIFFLFHV